MEKLVLATVAFALSQVTYAGLPGLAGSYAQSAMSAQQASAKVKRINATCDHISRIAEDGIIDIVLAFGYMDISGGQDFGDSGAYMYSVGNTLDMDARDGLESVFLSECRSFSSGGSKVRTKACGFSRTGNYLGKTISDRYTGKNLKVRLRLVAPSISPVDSQNQNSSAQQSRSAKVKQVFLNALQTADVVVYLGHARSGGGPDFSPPILKSNGHVNYDYYRSKREGISSMLGALKNTAREPSVIGILACKSSGLFAGSIRKYASDSVLVTADALFDFNDIVPTGYGIVEAVLNQSCGGEFSGIAKAGRKSAGFIDVSF